MNMETLTVSKKELQEVVRESLRGALSSELMKLRALALPTVSLKEQREIEKGLQKADRTIGETVTVMA